MTSCPHSRYEGEVCMVMLGLSEEVNGPYIGLTLYDDPIRLEASGKPPSSL